MIALAGQVDFQLSHGWYQTGDAKIVETKVQSVNLDLEQPEVRLTSCIDSSTLITRYVSNGKPIPEAGSDGKRRQFQSKLVFAPPAGSQVKRWFLVEEKAVGSC
ncbi:hypothetical protein Kfla_2448 [Kribbella flavida DSM 17836]|uniref:Uncharacterized protein n=1 Tax=Kribbella flavida (strain DSM 17836 / JCM 10339 / NBRC 14399) TaxID=479435 RepID=D2PW70_KRIFD|nr:hypothetical protein [Kribbella flavida]ADB31522.1 hypothetical protein Kfla_2448 [Kribbella flavida DSM 17836]